MEESCLRYWCRLVCSDVCVPRLHDHQTSEAVSVLPFLLKFMPFVNDALFPKFGSSFTEDMTINRQTCSQPQL